MSTPAAQVMASQVTEKAFLQQVKDYAKLRGWRVYHTFDSRRSDSGFPDLVLVRDFVIFAELKTETGRLTANQQAWYMDLCAADAAVFIWRPHNWPEIEGILR